MISQVSADPNQAITAELNQLSSIASQSKRF